MKTITPILTEKSLEAASNGEYTFWVDPSLSKYQVKELVNKIFGVNVVSVRTINTKQIEKRTLQGRKKKIMPKKKAIVRLKEKESISLFDIKE